MFWNFDPSITISLSLYFVTFIALLKIRKVELKKSWFVPVFALYFAFVFGTAFAIFLNGTDSSLSDTDSLLDIIIDILNPRSGRGKVMYGGYFGAIFGIWLANLVFKCKSLSIFFDIAATSTSLLYLLWRIGCFLDGCCYGQPSKTFGISFSKDSIAFRHLQGTDLVTGSSTVPLLPTQLISCAGDFAIFLFLLILFCKNKTRYPYFYFFAQMFLYGIGRFTIEFFRIDPREFWGPLSMSQWISLVLVAVSLVFFIKNRQEIVKSFRNPLHNCGNVS